MMINKSSLDGTMVTSRLMLHFDDLLSVVNDAQLKSMLKTYKEIHLLIKRASEQRKRQVGDRLTVSFSSSDWNWRVNESGWLESRRTRFIIPTTSTDNRQQRSSEYQRVNGESDEIQRSIRTIRCLGNVTSLQHQTTGFPSHRRIRDSQSVLSHIPSSPFTRLSLLQRIDSRKVVLYRWL